MNEECCSLLKRSRSSVEGGRTVLFVMSVDIHKAKNGTSSMQGQGRKEENKKKMLLWQFY